MIMMNFRLLKKQAKDKQAIKIDAAEEESTTTTSISCWGLFNKKKLPIKSVKQLT